MTAHTLAETFTDTRYYISATLPDTYDAPGYEATDLVWTEIGQVSDFPTYGSKRGMSTFQPIYGPAQKAKGGPNYGGGNVVMADVPADGGQVIMKAAEASQNHYSIKIVFPDGEVQYLDVSVFSWEMAAAKEAGFALRTSEIQVQRAPVIVAAQ